MKRRISAQSQRKLQNTIQALRATGQKADIPLDEMLCNMTDEQVDELAVELVKEIRREIQKEKEQKSRGST